MAGIAIANIFLVGREVEMPEVFWCFGIVIFSNRVDTENMRLDIAAVKTETIDENC